MFHAFILWATMYTTAQKKAATGGYAAAEVPQASEEDEDSDQEEEPEEEDSDEDEEEEPPSATTSKAFDIREKKWFNPWEQKVFHQVQACFDDSASGVVVMGVKPGRERAMTLWEWPALQQDLRHAYEEQAYPFFDEGEEVIAWDKVKCIDVTIDELSDELKHNTKKGKSVIVASCCGDHFAKVRECVQKHNQSQKAGHGKAFRCYGTAHDYQK